MLLIIKSPCIIIYISIILWRYSCLTSISPSHTYSNNNIYKSGTRVLWITGSDWNITRKHVLVTGARNNEPPLYVPDDTYTKGTCRTCSGQQRCVCNVLNRRYTCASKWRVVVCGDDTNYPLTTLLSRRYFPLNYSFEFVSLSQCFSNNNIIGHILKLRNVGLSVPNINQHLTNYIDCYVFYVTYEDDPVVVVWLIHCTAKLGREGMAPSPINYGG